MIYIYRLFRFNIYFNKINQKSIVSIIFKIRVLLITIKMNKSILLIATLLALSLVFAQDSRKCGNTGVSCQQDFTCCQCRPGNNPTFTCRQKPTNFYCWDNKLVNYNIARRSGDARPLVCPGDGLTPCPYGYVVDRTSASGCKGTSGSAFLEMLNEVDDS